MLSIFLCQPRERETDHVTVSSNQRCLYESAVRSAWCWIVVIKPYLKLLPMMLKLSYRFQLFKCWSNKFHTSPPFCEKNLIKILDNRRLLQDVFPPPKYEIILIWKYNLKITFFLLTNLVPNFRRSCHHLSVFMQGLTQLQIVFMLEIFLLSWPYFTAKEPDIKLLPWLVTWKPDTISFNQLT